MTASRGYATILALWLFVPALVIRTVMSLMGIINTRFTSENIDGIPVGTFNEIARTEYLKAFQLLGLAHMPGLLFGFVAAIWFRPMLPLAIALLLAESIIRRILLEDNPLLWFTQGPKIGVNFALTVLMALALIAAVSERRGRD